VFGERTVGATNNAGCRGKHDGYVTVWVSRKQYLSRNTATITITSTLINIRCYGAQAFSTNNFTRNIFDCPSASQANGERFNLRVTGAVQV